MISTILFDLDGTLLPMDQDHYLAAYFKRISTKLAAYGYEPKALIHAILKGTSLMVENDGHATNEAVFWDYFKEIYGEKALQDKPLFEEFYRDDFPMLQAECGFNPKAKETVTLLKQRGFRLALTTSPVFPAVATESRMRWAGLEPSDFELYTTYENCIHCKPNLAYYSDVMAQLGVKPEECLMVGNDVDEDMVVEALGVKAFLLTDSLINKNEADISRFPQGGFTELIEYIEKNA